MLQDVRLGCCWLEIPWASNVGQGGRTSENQRKMVGHRTGNLAGNTDRPNEVIVWFARFPFGICLACDPGGIASWTRGIASWTRGIPSWTGATANENKRKNN